MLTAYRNQSHAVHCADDHRPAKDPKDPSDREVCEFNLKTEFGDQCTRENDYGFKEGKPCILVKINKVCVIACLSSAMYSRLAALDRI